jgi:hypothetical protein
MPQEQQDCSESSKWFKQIVGSQSRLSTGVVAVVRGIASGFQKEQ